VATTWCWWRDAAKLSALAARLEAETGRKVETIAADLA
jgi:short-subunit dehydrogenase